MFLLNYLFGSHDDKTKQPATVGATGTFYQLTAGNFNIFYFATIANSLANLFCLKA